MKTTLKDELHSLILALKVLKQDVLDTWLCRKLKTLIRLLNNKK